MRTLVDRFRFRGSLLAVFVFLVALPEALPAGVGQWTTSGPEGGIVQTLAAYPSNPTTVYASSFRRLYKSVDAGARWVPTGLRVGVDLVVPTSDVSIVYATATGSPEVPIHRTTDGGETWIDRAPPLGRLTALAQDGNDPMTLYAATSSGLFRTGNGGDSWDALPGVVNNAVAVAAVAVDPADTRVLYAALGVGTVSGVYRSTDRAATWTPTALRDPAYALIFASSAGSLRDAGVQALYALTTNGARVTSDGGVTWRQVARGRSVSRLTIDPANPAHLYMISGDAVLQSLDGGETVTPVGNGAPGAGLRGIVASESSVVLLGSDTGVSRSGDAGRTWDPANQGIHEIFVHSVAIDPADPAVVFAAGPGKIYESRNAGQSWSEPASQSPDAEALGFDPSDRSTLYAGGSAGVQKSTDGGQTWKTSLTDQIGDLLIDPNNPRRLFAAYRGVYRTLDGSDSWRKVMTPDDNYSTYYYGGPPTVTALALAPSDSSIVYAGGDTGFVYRSDDGGENWSDLHAEVGPVNALAVDSCEPEIVHAGGWGTVYRSLDGGHTWSAATAFPWSSEVPFLAAYAIARDPRHSSTIFAGTSSGLAWSIDRGATWKKFEPALNEPVRSIAIDSSGRFLYAGTETGLFVLERTFEPCSKGADRLCLLGSKYQVSVTARNPRTGASIPGHAIDEGDRFGYFSFPDVTGDSTFPEVFVKMLDASNAPPPYGGSAWVFHSSLTDLDYTLTVRETASGRVRTYRGERAASLTCGEADTSAFGRACEARVASIAPESEASFDSPSGAELSLLGGRFRATVRATDPRTGRVVEGAAFPRADGFGYFGLPGLTADPAFPEIFVKMADGRGNGGHFWVFHTGLTDLSYELTVRDTLTGAVRIYPGGATSGTRLCGAADTSAF
jgi:photosystem II stability/assembly factor-like uncharacterized protein